MSRRRRALFAVAVVSIATLVPVAVLLSIDVYLHRKYERTAGFNVWGYRGPTVGRKIDGEYRVVVLGGSAAFGYGVDWNQSWPVFLEERLARTSHPGVKRFTVINLGYNNEGAYSFRFTLDDYRALQYDLVCLYEGYNDMMGPNLSVFRHNSPIFKLTGYLPIFPIIFKEKATVMLTGDVNNMYLFGGRTVFTPGPMARTGAAGLRFAAAVGEALEAQLARTMKEPPHQIDDTASTGCRNPWREYCQSVLAGVEDALARHAQVLALGQPHSVGPLFRAQHIDQQTELRDMLHRRFGGDPRVRYVDLGDVVDLGDPAMSGDRMHLTADGNGRVADALVEPVLDMAARRTAKGRN